MVQGLLKPFTFAIIISLVGCFYGMRTTGGTQGVGRSTTQAVVVSSIWIFVTTYFIGRNFRQPLMGRWPASSHGASLRRCQPALRRTPALDHVSFAMGAGRNARRVWRGRQRQDDAAEDRAGTGESRIPDVCMLFGQDVDRFPESELFRSSKQVGILFQEGGLFDSMTIAENVAYPLLNQVRSDRRGNLSERKCGREGARVAAIRGTGTNA